MSGDKVFKSNFAKLRSQERLEMLEIKRVLKLSLHGLKIQTVLDVGTGTGLFAEYFTKEGCHVTGIDLNPNMLKEAQTFVPTGKFIKGEMENLPFPDDSFDLVFLGHVLHETDELARSFAEASRVAKKAITVLEWPYRKEEAGPPIDHRLKPETIEALNSSIKCSTLHKWELTHMVLYRFEMQKIENS